MFAASHEALTRREPPVRVGSQQKWNRRGEGNGKPPRGRELPPGKKRKECDAGEAAKQVQGVSAEWRKGAELLAHALGERSKQACNNHEYQRKQQGAFHGHNRFGSSAREVQTPSRGHSHFEPEKVDDRNDEGLNEGKEGEKLLS